LSGAGVGIKTGTATATGVFRTVGIAGVIVDVVVGAVEIGAARGVVSFCARHGKTVS
jgi:hypothetical protein